MGDFFQQLMENPHTFIDNSYDELFKMTPRQIETFQQHWAAKRFADLRPNIPVLDKLARDQGIDKVNSIDDVAPLLFAHTVYKSYPLSYLERNRFDRLTKWLSKVTTTDLSHIDASAIDCIDDWIDMLDRETPLMICHTSGTTGKLSFLPRTKEQSRIIGILTSNLLRDWEGPNTRSDMLKEHRPVINPGYRFGAGTAQRMADTHVEFFAGGDENALFLYPDSRLSADLLSLSGRLRVAEARGEQGALAVSPALLRRREEWIEQEKQRPEAMKRFLENARVRFGGQDVYIGAALPIIYDWAVTGLAEGHPRTFGENSFLSMGGGTKGRDIPDDWPKTMHEFLGFTTFQQTYAMTESMVKCTLCDAGKFHMPPLMIPYLLDPRSGDLLPRKEGTTGRFAFMDLLADTYWAGLISGDEVTMGGWDRTCECGRTGNYVESTIRRYSDAEGGDDKVLCSGAPEAHDKALDFLTEAAR
jgi:hypothetical protein